MKPREKAAIMGASGDGDTDGLAAAARSIIADARRALADSELSTPKPCMRCAKPSSAGAPCCACEHWPLTAINFDTVADGLISTYRRARQLLPGNWAEADAEHLHDPRRRVVEHRHQLDRPEVPVPGSDDRIGYRCAFDILAIRTAS